MYRLLFESRGAHLEQLSPSLSLSRGLCGGGPKRNTGSVEQCMHVCTLEEVQTDRDGRISGPLSITESCKFIKHMLHGSVHLSGRGEGNLVVMGRRRLLDRGFWHSSPDDIPGSIPYESIPLPPLPPHHHHHHDPSLVFVLASLGRRMYDSLPETDYKRKKIESDRTSNFKKKHSNLPVALPSFHPSFILSLNRSCDETREKLNYPLPPPLLPIYPNQTTRVVHAVVEIFD